MSFRPLAIIVALACAACAHDDALVFAGAACGGVADGIAYAATAAVIDSTRATDGGNK